MTEDHTILQDFIGESGKQLPVIETASEKDMAIWVRTHLKEIEKILLTYGGVLLRNFGLYSVSEFNKVAQVVCPNLFDYIYRSTPRTRLGGKIYTATEYPPEKTIPQHNENAYSKNWPSKIIFGSILVAEEGGETPIADSRRVYKKIPIPIREAFEEKGVLYVRNYRPNVDLSWQEVFQTEDRKEVEIYCEDNGIEYEWNKGNADLTTKQVCQASIIHPETKEKVWFNQAHLFHITGLEKKERESLIKEFGEEGLPRNTFYGDGSPFDPKDLDLIREIYEEEKVVFPWQRGDVMVLDNRLMTHGRNSFKGPRKVVVAMG